MSLAVRGRFAALWFVALSAAPLALPAGARAQAPDRPEIVRVRVGFEGRYKVGHWTPVDVTVRGRATAVQGVVVLRAPDSDGATARVGAWASQANLCQLLPGRESTVRMYVKFGQTEGGLAVSVHEAARAGDALRAGKTLASKTFETGIEAGEDRILSGMAATQPLFVTLGPGTLGIEEAVRLADTAGGDAPSWDREAVAVVLTGRDAADQLPTRWYGYEGVDALAVATSAPEMLRRLAPDGARLRALDEWVRMGGKLVLFVGAQADEVLAPDAPLARFAPGRLDEVITLRRTAAFESFAGGARPVPGAGAQRAEVRVPRLRGVEGAVEAAEGEELPLVVRRAYGLGQVVFVAADLDRPPLARWPDRAKFLQKVLDLAAAGAEGPAEGGALVHYGYNDVSGQLRSALDQFAGVKMVSFWLVAGLVLLYILLIGPGDYFFLRKVAGRMQWTWVTFPAIVAAVSLGAYALAYRLKGDQLRANQVDVVDVDAATGFARGATWLNLFSPRTGAYDLAVEARLPDGRPAENAAAVVSWLGLAGDGLGGMRSRPGAAPLWGREYDFSPDLDAMAGVPVQVWSTKGLTARWSAPCEAYPAVEIVEKDQLPEGTVTNTLAFPLERCVLAFGRWGYALGTVGPGETVRIEPMSRARIELTTLLRGPGGDLTDPAVAPGRAYDRDGADLFEIVRTMMFFEALGGARHTGLLNRYQGFVDGSGLLRARRALLVAAAPAGSGPLAGGPGTVVLRDGQPLGRPGDKHVVLLRFVYPVGKKSHD